MVFSLRSGPGPTKSRSAGKGQREGREGRRGSEKQLLYIALSFPDSPTARMSGQGGEPGSCFPGGGRGQVNSACGHLSFLTCKISLIIVQTSLSCDKAANKKTEKRGPAQGREHTRLDMNIPVLPSGAGGWWPE